MLEAMRCVRKDPRGAPLEGGIDAPDPVPFCGRQCEETVGWRREVALEISVEIGSVAAIIRLAGTLDRATSVNVTDLVSELIEDGYHEFELNTSALCAPDEEGIGVLIDLERLVRVSGGHLTWSGSTANRQILTMRPVNQEAQQM